MDAHAKRHRYERIRRQLEELFVKTRDPVARMATAAALLAAKMPQFFWTGWYLLRDGDLTVGPYQGSLACLVLSRHTGVCWTAVDRGETVIVPDVREFPGHIACDCRSLSEIAVVLRDASGAIAGVLDVDAAKPAQFDAVDGEELEAITPLIFKKLE